MSSELGYVSLFGGLGSSQDLIARGIESSATNNAVVSSPLPEVTYGDESQYEELPSEQDEADEPHGASETDERPDQISSDMHRWRYRTYNERSLAASLDRLEDDDLAIHLYNTHSLKRRLYKRESEVESPQSSNEEQPRKRIRQDWRHKRSWRVPYDEQGNQNWYPSRLWTAWPMEPDVVPRPRERQERDWGRVEEEGKGSLTGEDNPRWNPSQEMEEVLLAELSKKAREKFDGREWEDPDQSSDRSIDEMSSVRTSARRSQRENGKPGHEPGGLRTTTRKNDVRLKYSRNDGFRSDGAWSRSGAETSGDEIIKIRSPLKPVVMADDDKARRILHLPICHLLHKLDSLLMGLHNSRQNHFDRGGSDSGTDTQTSRESSAVPPRKTSLTSRRSHSRSSSKAVKEKQFNEDGQVRAVRRLRQRDWSEVLGIATMTGWNGAVVQRAAARCSRLFGEKMDFRNLDHEMRNSNALNPGRDEAEPRASGLVTFGGVHEDGFMKPIDIDAGKGRRKKRVGKVDSVSQHDLQVGTDAEHTSESSAT